MLHVLHIDRTATESSSDSPWSELFNPFQLRLVNKFAAFQYVVKQVLKLCQATGVKQLREVHVGFLHTFSTIHTVKDNHERDSFDSSVVKKLHEKTVALKGQLVYEFHGRGADEFPIWVPPYTVIHT